MSEPTIFTHSDQIEIFVNKVRKRLDSDVFLRCRNYGYAPEVFDIKAPNEVLIVRYFYDDMIWMNSRLASLVNKDIDCPLVIFKSCDDKFSMFYSAKKDTAYLNIPTDYYEKLSWAIYNVHLTVKKRQKIVVRTQQYCRRFIYDRFGRVY